jgi:aminoglycoside phosphotransferase (APT) family kinase protein
MVAALAVQKFTWISVRMTSSLADRPTEVRRGEELDLERLRAFLDSELPDVLGRGTDEIRVRQFPCGFSNLTYLVSIGDSEMVLRRPPFGAKIKSAHDMEREFRILSALADSYAKVPKTLICCQDPDVLGAPFYLMERVVGVILRPKMAAGLEPEPATMAAIAGSLVDTLVELHAVDYQDAGLADLGRGEGYALRQVEGWTGRYETARTDDVPTIEMAAAWLAENPPPPASAALIHNDFKYDNLVLDSEDLSRVVAVLDWEMATLGDPLMDLGTSLGYWVDPDDPPEMLELRLSPTTISGNPSRLQVAERYAGATGHSLDHLVFYYVYGLFKIAVIIQQIYARYQRGDTRDPRFRSLIDGVRLCGLVASQAISKGRIDRLFV